MMTAKETRTLVTKKLEMVLTDAERVILEATNKGLGRVGWDVPHHLMNDNKGNNCAILASILCDYGYTVTVNADHKRMNISWY